MKKIILLALGLSFASLVHAKQIAKIENNAGGAIYLTDVVVKGGVCDGLLRAYTTADDNSTALGCWVLDGEVVLIRWLDSDDLSSYPVEDFKMLVKSKGKRK